MKMAIEEKIVRREEYDRLQIVADREFSLILALLWDLGMRIREILQVRGKDVVVEDGAVWLRLRRKGGSVDRVPVWRNATAGELLRWIRENSVGPEEYVFPARRRGQIVNARKYHRTVRWAELRLEKMCELAGIRRLTPHMFRHTVCSRMVEEGFSPLEIAQITGHRNISTLQIYSHPSKVKIAEKLREREE